MRNLFNNKLFITLFIFLLIIFTFSSVFADYTGVTHSFDRPDLINWISKFEQYQSGNYYYILVDKANTPNSSSTCYVEFIDKEYYDSHNIKTYLSFENGYYYLNYTEPVLTCVTWNGSGSLYQGLDYRSKSVCGFAPSSVTDNVADLTFDTSLSRVYKDSTCDATSIFFRVPLQGITQTLVEETMKAQVMEQLKATIVGFLKYLIVFVISVIAFWKGWQFLSMQLKKA